MVHVKVDLQAQIKVRINETVNDANGHGTAETRIVETTVGRAILFSDCSNWTGILVG